LPVEHLPVEHGRFDGAPLTPGDIPEHWRSRSSGPAWRRRAHGYVQIHDVICHVPFGHQLSPAEVERAYRRQLELGDRQGWPTGYWRSDHRFVLTDGRNRFVACLMLGIEYLFVAWLVPASN
jgi:hypothetical protein